MARSVVVRRPFHAGRLPDEVKDRLERLLRTEVCRQKYVRQNKRLSVEEAPMVVQHVAMPVESKLNMVSVQEGGA